MGHAVEGTVAWLKKLPPGQRIRALKLLKNSPSRHVREIEAAARHEIELAMRHGCSMPRINAFQQRGEHYHVRGMKLSRYGSRVGNHPGVRETQRWTPPQAVGDEDRYDRMDAIDAALCNDPPSVSGLQFQQLQMRRGRIEKQKLKKNNKADA